MVSRIEGLQSNIPSVKRWDVNQNGLGQSQKTWKKEKKPYTATETETAMPIWKKKINVL